jgi:DNA-binding transcriptional LysR family regulator
MADVALGPDLGGADVPGVESRPVMRCRLVVVGSAGDGGRITPPRFGLTHWLVDPSATDPTSATAGLLARCRVPDERVRVFPSQTAAWSAAADGQGVAPALAHLVMPEVRRGRLRVLEVPGTPAEVQWHVSTLGPGRRSAGTTSLCHFLGTPGAMQLMHRPGQGVPPNRFRPPVYVTIWS